MEQKKVLQLRPREQNIYHNIFKLIPASNVAHVKTVTAAPLLRWQHGKYTILCGHTNREVNIYQIKAEKRTCPTSYLLLY